MFPDYLLQTTLDGLMARLEPMTVDAGIVVDLGSATGAAGRPLGRRFRGARVVALDRSLPALAAARSKKSWLSRTVYVQAGATALPFADQSIDVMVSNLLLPQLPDAAPVFAEVARVLRKDGLFAFATLGPDSLQGLQAGPFADMHDTGDALVRAGLRDPVLDVDRLTVTFEDSRSLLEDFGAIVPAGARVSSVEFELVYGHCWGSGARPVAGEVRIDPGKISRRK